MSNILITGTSGFIAWYGPDADRVGLSHCERPGHERDPVFDISRIREELGFAPERDVRP